MTAKGGNYYKHHTQHPIQVPATLIYQCPSPFFFLPEREPGVQVLRLYMGRLCRSGEPERREQKRGRRESQTPRGQLARRRGQENSLSSRHSFIGHTLLCCV